jgi:hypothetical protein
MAKLARVRVNTQVPFPAMVTGSGPVTLGKSNGVWTIGLATAQLQQKAPPAANNATNFLIAYDAVAGAFFSISFADLKTALT